MIEATNDGQEDEELWDHEKRRPIEGARRRVRKVIPDPDDHETKQREGTPDLGGSD